MFTCLMLCSGSVMGKQQVQRLNYGVVFEPQNQLQLSGEVWLHTFEIPLPEGIDLQNAFACKKESCQSISNLLQEIRQIRHSIKTMITSTLDSIKKLIPERQLINRNRHRRSVLPFIGDISWSIFGTATVKDVERMARHINFLNKISTKLIKVVEQHENDLSSSMTASDERTNDIAKGLHENSLAITQIENQLNVSLINMEKTFSKVSGFLTEQIEKSRQLESLFEELLEGVYDLVKGKLSPHPIKADTMLKTLQDIQSILDKKFPGFHLVYKNPSLIYHYIGTIFARKGSSLYVSVKFPISPFRRPLDLFKVKTFPIPVNDSTNHATQLLDTPDYFAITDDLQYYILFQDEELVTCQSNSLKQCNFPKILTPAVETSCMLALFTENNALVKRLCNFRFLTYHVSSNVVLLSRTSILAYDVDVLEFDCKTGKTMNKGCKFCQMDVPCECSVLTSNSYIPARLTECHKNTSEKLHPVNLALLQNFFEDDLLKNIGSNTLFNTLLQVDIPKFSIYNH